MPILPSRSGTTDVPIVFITGVTGQDGTYLARRLLDEGAEVHGLVRPGSTAALEDGVIPHSGDLRDVAGLAELVAQLKPDELYHLGGETSVAASWEDPVASVELGSAPVTALLHAVSARGLTTHFVNASSAEIFGMASAPQDELTPLHPVSPYGAVKAFGHLLVDGYRRKGVHASSCILFNHESPLRPERFVTRKITRAAARISRGLQSGLSLGNLDAARDWSWAPDVVDALIRAARHDEPDDFVIGSGVVHTVRDFVIAAFAAADIPDWEQFVTVDESFVREVDPAVQQANASRAHEKLGWRTTVDFDELVTRMVGADLHAIDD